VDAVDVVVGGDALVRAERLPLDGGQGRVDDVLAPHVPARREARLVEDERLGGVGDDPVAGAQLREALDMLAPLAGACGGDLARFLAEIALGAEVDTWDPRADRVSLLTLHAAKGLEFPVVFLVGCEDGLLPLHWGDPAAADLHEERRLLFVGMTRARSHLYLTHARGRSRHGVRRPALPSPFLADIDQALLERLADAPQPRRPVEPRGDQLSLL
jgi:ATP-dependent exoDNAse (exonuclease V) beta subunit